MCSPRLELCVRRIEPLDRKAKRTGSGSRSSLPATCLDTSWHARVERKCRGSCLELAPPGRFKLQRKTERVAVERDRPAHLGHINHDVIDFVEHGVPPGFRLRMQM